MIAPPLSATRPVNLIEDFTFYMQSVQVARCHMLLISDFMKARSYSWKWLKGKACSFVEQDKAYCVFCFWCLKDEFFFSYCIVCKAKSFELFTLEITFPDKRAKQCLFKLFSGTWLVVFTTFLWHFGPAGSTWRGI